MNTPVVSFDCPNGPSEIIQDGVNGYLAKHLDVKDLINKIILMLQNKFDYEDLKYLIENEIRKIYNQYKNLINSYI